MQLSEPTDEFFHGSNFTQLVDTTDLRMDLLYECYQTSKKAYHARWFS